MKKIIQSFLVATTVTIVVVSCKEKALSGADPKTVLVEFFNLLAKKDIDAASKLATQESQMTLSMMKWGLASAESKGKEMPGENDLQEEIKQIELGEAKINGDTATVPITYKRKNVNGELILKIEEGAWKVDFSIATLRNLYSKHAKAGFDAMKKDRTDPDAEKLQERMDSVIKEY